MRQLWLSVVLAVLACGLAAGLAQAGGEAKNAPSRPAAGCWMSKVGGSPGRTYLTWFYCDSRYPGHIWNAQSRQWIPGTFTTGDKVHYEFHAVLNGWLKVTYPLTLSSELPPPGTPAPLAGPAQ